MADLTGAERRWLDHDRQRHTTDHDRNQARRIAGTFLETITAICTALRNATPTSPPPRYGTRTARRGSDPSDPALAAITATMHAIDLGLTRLGHLFDDCPLCDAQLQGPGHNGNVITLAALVGHDLTEVADHLTGLSATSPIADPTAKAEHAAALAVRLWIRQWDQSWQNGAEPQALRDATGKMANLASRARSLRSSLAWVDQPNHPQAINQCPCIGHGCNHNSRCHRHTDGTRKVCTACSTAQSRTRCA